MIGSFFDGVGVRDTRIILCLMYTIAYFRYGGNGVLEILILHWICMDVMMKVREGFINMQICLCSNR